MRYEFVDSSIFDDTADYKLYLTGGLVESKAKLDEHLKMKWVDTKTRRLCVDFQVFTPDAELVTAVEIRMTTDYGLSYVINTDVSKLFPFTLYFIHGNAMFIKFS